MKSNPNLTITSSSKNKSNSLDKFFLSSSAIMLIIFEKLGDIGYSNFAANSKLVTDNFNMCSLG